MEAKVYKPSLQHWLGPFEGQKYCLVTVRFVPRVVHALHFHRQFAPLADKRDENSNTYSN